MLDTPRQRFFLILILGSMTALSPFSIDMYLPAFPEIAKDFGTSVARVSLSLSSYFIGLAIGQLFYGPLLDRFGRKPPLYVGLGIYTLTSLACLWTETIDGLVALRALQAIGGCAAGVASMSIVRDLFTTQESAKIFSLLILILGASPLMAPTIGGYLSVYFGWHSVFIALASISTLIFLAAFFYLPESHKADHSISLHPFPIVKNFYQILKNPQFYTYSLACAVAFSGLFAYLAGSPIIFMNNFGVSTQTYSWIFAFIAAGLIGASQVNVIILQKFKNAQILQAGLIAQMCIGIALVLGVYLDLYNIYAIVILLFFFLSCLGFTNPNGAALCLEPFSKNTGSAAALMGFLQMGIGALVSMVVGLLSITETLSIAAILAGTAIMGVTILFIGKRRIGAPKVYD